MLLRRWGIPREARHATKSCSCGGGDGGGRGGALGTRRQGVWRMFRPSHTARPRRRGGDRPSNDPLRLAAADDALRRDRVLGLTGFVRLGASDQRSGDDRPQLRLALQDDRHAHRDDRRVAADELPGHPVRMPDRVSGLRIRRRRRHGRSRGRGEHRDRALDGGRRPVRDRAAPLDRSGSSRRLAHVARL